MKKSITGNVVFTLLLLLCMQILVAEPCGDVNSSGGINIIDALMTAQHYVGLNPQGFDAGAADVNGDGAINIIDALQMAQYYVGLITKFDGCTGTPKPTETPGPNPNSDIYAAVPIGFASLNGGTTGGAGGQVVTVSNQSDLAKYAGASGPYIIKVQGTINISPKGTEINVTSNKTIVGIGANATIYEGGFRIINQKNVIIRNLTIGYTYKADDHAGKEQDWDGIQVDTSQNLWFDHCHFTRGGDGLMDLRKDTTYVTVSWCIFSHHNKTWGIGWTENVTARMTIHHNWIHDTEIRNPSFDNAIGHLYNNFLEDISGYGNWIRGRSIAVIENSYYKNVKDPWYVDDGEMVTRGNITVNCSGQQEANKGTAFNPSSYYSYSLDPTESVPELLQTYAGPSANIQY